MSFKNFVSSAIFSLGACLLASQAHAIALTDVSFQNSLGGINNPTAAAQGVKKPKKSVINGLGGLFAGDQWSVLDKTNKPSKTFNGVDFVLTADTKHRSGNWGLSWDSPELTADMDFVLVLKGGSQWAAYLFEAGNIDSDSGSIAGLFNMPLTNKHGKKAKLRRATIFGRLADIGNPDPNDPNDPNHPNDPNDPNHPNDPNDPNHPNDPNDPNHPNDPNDPNHPNDPNDPNHPNDPKDPTDPIDRDPPNQDPTAIPIPNSLTLVIVGLALCGRLPRRRLAR